jgi:Ca2+-binding RTX toxin-like protein
MSGVQPRCGQVRGQRRRFGATAVARVGGRLNVRVVRVDIAISAHLLRYPRHRTLPRLTSGAIDGTGNGLANTIWGNASGNTLSGLGDNDWLHGLGGNDALWGDSGADSLWGGAGADMLYGGTGNDRFIIESAADATDGLLHDHIMDFSSGDRIDVSSIDANSMVAGNQAFSYLGANPFTGVAGQLNYVGG